MTDTAPTTKLTLDDRRAILARNLSAARGALGLSQDQLAETAGVSRATIIQMEGAEGDPRLSTLLSVATALGAPPALLLLSSEELDAIVHAPASDDMERAQEHLSREDVAQIKRLMSSGISKNRAKATAIATGATIAAGFSSSPAIAAAAIGTMLIPGVGTAMGAALIAWLAHKNGERDPGDLAEQNPPDSVEKDAD